MDRVRTVKEHGKTKDQLMGTDLVEGEKVRVLWDDANPFPPITETHEVHIDEREKDHDSLAYVVVPFHRTTNRVYLRWKKSTMLDRAV